MRCFFLILSLIFSLNLFADHIEITTDQVNLQAGRHYGFRVFLVGNDRTDITSLVQFKVTAPWINKGNGHFLVQPDVNGMYYNATVSSQYVRPDGSMLFDSLNVTVDSTPNFINIIGPYSIFRRSSVQYRAMAIYPEAQYEITRTARWSAFYGTIMSGFYTPPFGNIFNDKIQCQFGGNSQFFNVNFY